MAPKQKEKRSLDGFQGIDKSWLNAAAAGGISLKRF